jgi:tetratricopeptide (TPR) repeat protein
MTCRVGHAVAIALAWSLSGGCTNAAPSAGAANARDANTAPVLETLPPVVLPDVSSLAESVQRQVHERDAELAQTLKKAGAPREERAAAYAALGRVLMAAKFSDEAATCYLHAEALASGDMRWPYYVGHAYMRKGDRGRAAAAFERALKLRPSDLNALVWLGETYLDDGRLDLAQSTFQRALLLQPQSAAALFGAGRTALARQSYAEAVQDMERALVVDGHATAVHYPLAMAYRAQGDREKAETHLRQRGTAFPDFADPLIQPDAEILESPVAYEDRGMQALKSADFGAAAAAFRKGLELEPDDAALRYWLGAALYAEGDTAGAEREFAAVVRQAPEFAKAHFSLAAIEDARGHRLEAIKHFRAAVTADPGLPEARLRLADDLRATGQLAASFAEYEAAVRLDPAVAEAWIGGAQALISLKQNQKALDWLMQARRLHPSRPELAELQKRVASAQR